MAAKSPIDLPDRTKQQDTAQPTMATTQKVYVDEDTGADETTTPGSEEKPFKTLQFAYVQTQGAGEYLTRKSVTGLVAEGSDKSTLLEWKPAAKAVSGDSTVGTAEAHALYRVSRKLPTPSKHTPRKLQKKQPRLNSARKRTRHARPLWRRQRRSLSRKTPLCPRH